jgi:hypothetical protein
MSFDPGHPRRSHLRPGGWGGPRAKRIRRFPVDQHPELEGLSDRDLLELAIREGRVLVTANVRHFLPLLTEMNAAERTHAGCILVPRSIRSKDFGTLVFGIEEALEDTSREEWVALVKWVRKR